MSRPTDDHSGRYLAPKQHQSPQEVAAILARYRPDVPPEEIIDRPLGIPHVDPPYALREVNLSTDNAGRCADAETIAQWMSLPHLVDTWEQPWSAQRWLEDWHAKLSTSYARPLIVQYQKDRHSELIDVGYTEIYRPHRDEIAGVYHSQPHDLAWHIAIGDPELTGKGLFSPFLKQLSTALLDMDPECDLVIVEPDYRNRQIHRALEKTEGWINMGQRQQRADRRVQLFFFPREATADIHSRALPQPSADCCSEKARAHHHAARIQQ